MGETNERLIKDIVKETEKSGAPLEINTSRILNKHGGLF